MQKIMFFDIDGTLMEDSHEHRIPTSTIKALELAKQAGNLIYVNTGRPLCNVDNDIRSLNFHGYICGCGTYVECEGQELFYHTVNKKLCIETAELIRNCNASPLYERRDGMFFDFNARQLSVVDSISNHFRLQGKNVNRTVEDKDFSFDKFIICFDKHTDIDKLRYQIEKNFFWIDRGYGFAEIVPLECSKKIGIELILKHYGIDKSKAYAVGDSLNDLPMFDAVGTSIAMGNGEKLIPHASYVTDDICKDGIYNAMRHFNFFDT